MESLKPLAMSQTVSQPVASRSGLDQASLAAKKAAIMFGCYRKGDANDPEIYTMAVAATLAEYPAEVIEYVTDPRTGLPAKLKWLPTVAEVREACENHKGYLRARNNLIAKGYRFAEDGRLIKPGDGYGKDAA